MGYVFRGFLTKSAQGAEAAVQRWPLCEAKYEDEQMGGFVVRCPNEDDLHPTEGDDAYERVLEQIEEVQSGLQSLSVEFSNEFFVYIEVTCFGGTCTNTGFQVLNGQTVAVFEVGQNEADIAEILKPLRISFGEDQYFKPFTRGYFERDRLQTSNRVTPSESAIQSPTPTPNRSVLNVDDASKQSIFTSAVDKVFQFISKTMPRLK